MNVLIFQDKQFSGGIQEVINQIKVYYANMLKYIDVPEDQIEAKMEHLKKEQQSLSIKYRKCLEEEKSAIKEKLDEFKSQIQRLQSICLVKQKIEELMNFEKSQGASGVVENIDIHVFEIETVSIPSPQISPLQQNEEVKEPIIDSSKTAIQRQCEEYMIFAKPMPECFEKTLIRICYCLSILQIVSEDEPEIRVKSNALFIETKEKMLGLLKEDLKNIKQQISDEKFEESSVEKQLQEVHEYFTTTHPMDYNYDYLNTLLTLLQKVRPFSFQEFFHLISKCETNSDRISNKDIVLLLGTTGAGKSTTIQYLYGAKMGKARDGHIQAAEMPKQLEDFVSSAAMCSITRYINPLHVTFINQDEEEDSFEIVDTPGFGDTQSVEVDISNTIGIIRSVTKANKVYPVFLFSEKNVGGRAEIMKSLINFYSCLIKDMSKNVKSCNFFFSHFSDKNKDMEEFIKSIITHLNPQEHSNLVLKDVLRHMRDLGQQKKLLILDPLDGNYKKVLNQILETNAIANPRNKFSLNIVERSRNYLDKQVQLHEKAILALVSIGNTELALWKIEELIKLNEIFIQFESTYKDSLQSVISQITSLFNKIIDGVLERFQICLKGSNELYDTDIAKFQEALTFERKIMPLIARIKTLDMKPGEKDIFSDQHKQSQLISAVTSQCDLTLTQLDKCHEINEDEWIHFITKAIKLSQSIAGFESIEKNCLNRFTEKFQKFSMTAKKIINKAQITDYTSIALYQSQLSEEYEKKSKTSFKSKKQFEEDSEGIKTDSDLDQTSLKQKQNNPHILSSSDSQEEIQSDQRKGQVIHQKNNINDREKPRHNKFKEVMTILVQSHLKIRIVQNQEFQDNLEKTIKDIIICVLNLEEKVKPHFRFFQSENQEFFQTLSQDDVQKIKQSLAMLESYNNACQNIDKHIQQNLEKLFEKYKLKCKSLFDVHNQKFLEMTQQQDANKASDIKLRYEQILLLIQIQQIKESTGTHFQYIKVWLQNKIQFSITEIEQILQQFGNQNSNDQGLSNNKGTQPQIKRLKEALTSLKTLSETQKEGDQFIKSKFNTIQECFDKLIHRLYQEANPFQSLSQESPQNILPIANIFEQIEEIYLAADIINIKSNLKQNVGIEWIESLKSTLQRIQTESEKLNDVFMKQKDYRNYDQFVNYLRNFTEGCNISCTQMLLRKVNTMLLAENSPKIDPNSIISNLRGYLQDQANKKIQVFEQLFSNLQDITSVGPDEISDSEENKEQNMNILQDQVGDEMKKISAQIIELFKIEYDVKAKYPHLSQQILDSLSNNDDEHFVNHYTKKFISDYFFDLEKNKITMKSTKWIFLKLQSIKYLRELDEYLHNLRGKSTVKDIYQILDDRYYQDPSSEVSKAKENFQKSSFQEIKEQLDQLSQFKNENNNQIKSKIIAYLNQQVKTKYELIIAYQAYDHTLNQTQIQIIAQTIEQLFKIDQELENYIQLQQKKVKDVIEEDVIRYLLDCFQSYSAEIDKYLFQQNYFQAFEKIDRANSLFKEFHRLVGIDARQTKAFIELHSKCNQISEKINALKESIEKLFQKILSSNAQDFGYQFNPRAIIENIAKIVNITKTEHLNIVELLQNFEQQLFKQQNQELRGISNQKENTKDLDELKNFIYKIQIMKDSLQFLPEVIREQMGQKLDSEHILIQDKIKELQSREITRFKLELKNADKASDLCQILNSNKRIIDEDLKDYITVEVSSKLNQLQTLSDQKLLDQQVDQVVQNDIPLMKEFFDEPILQNYINSKQSGAYMKLVEQINSSIKQAIGFLSKYFVDSHSSSTGEPFQRDIQQLMNEKYLKVQICSIKSVCQISQQKSKLGDLFKFDESLKAFVEDSTQYLKKIKEIHRVTLKINPKENMASLSNLRFTTNLILNQPDFKDLVSLLNVVFEDELRQFNQEIQECNFKHMQDESISWLDSLKKPLWHQEFTSKTRGEDDRAEFYKIIQGNFEIIVQAQHVDALMVPEGKTQPTIPFKIREEYYNKLIEKIQVVVKCLNQQTQYLKQAQKQNEFDVLYNSLKSMSENLPIARNFIEKAIENAEQDIKDYLNYLTGKAKNFYQTDKKPDLRQFSLILVDVQLMKVNYAHFDNLLKQTLDNMFEDYQKFREKDPQAASTLQNHLRGLPGPEGTLLAQTHSYFKGTNILKDNELFQKKTVDEVINQIEGTDLAENEKTQLVQFYEQYHQSYQQIIEEKLIVRYESSGQRIPIDLSSIVVMIKNKLTSEESKKWNEDDIFGDIKLGSPLKPFKKLPLLLAHIFALWSLLNSEHYLKQEKNEGQNKYQLQKYLLQPHPAQIISILRILGVGYSKQFNIGDQLGKFVNWVKHFGTESEDQTSAIRNNLVQIRTGEGKSVVLAIVSIIFALNGFEVNCACYSNYLSERDYIEFQKLFNKLGVNEYIKYGTFNEIAENKINRECSIRESIQNLVVKKEFQKSNVKITERIEYRPQVLLIDEVDVFFSSQFFGKTYNPQALIKHDSISALIDLIWKNRQSMLRQTSIVSLRNKVLDNKDANNTKNQTYMSLRGLKKTKEYEDALNIFKPEFQFLLEEAVKKMIIDVVDYQSDSHKYVVYLDAIGYHYQDQISTNQTKGYKTLFAYYEEEKNNQISSASLKSKKAIGINCASFSYAEVPLDYQIILGVTGTLKTISSAQKKIIENLYNIQHSTLSPSVHLSDESQIFNQLQDTQIRKSNEYYKDLVKFVKTKYLYFNRPVILFFENEQKLKEFAKSKPFSSCQTLSEVDNNKQKESKVYKATQESQVTLTTRIFGRGTDFRCYDKKVIESGGLVVIQTFLSQDLSEETQIRGRTGRQGTEGKYVLFLNLADLQDFNIQEKDIKESSNHYETLCRFRDKKLDDQQNELSKFRDQLLEDHQQSMQMVAEVIKLAKNQYQYDPAKITPLTEHLLDQNKGITLETDDLFMKVLILIDCTGSMGATLQKTKNCVRAMIDEARAELKKVHLNEDIILIKIGGYRNYSSLEEQLFQVSTDWTADPKDLTAFLDEKLQTSGGQGNEAMEIGLQFANQEIKNQEGIPLSMVIVIGDAAPNTPEEVVQKRNGAALNKGDPNYWQKTNYQQPTNWDRELNSIKTAGIPVYSFYINKSDRKAYEQLAVNGGKSAFLDITNEAKGQQQLKDFFKYLIVYRATEINRGQEEALKSVSEIKVSFN